MLRSRHALISSTSTMSTRSLRLRTPLSVVSFLIYTTWKGKAGGKGRDTRSVMCVCVCVCVLCKSSVFVCTTQVSNL